MYKPTTLFKISLFTFAFSLFTFSFAQESKVAKIDSLQTTSSNIPNSIQVEEGDVKITDGTNTLIRITDEGTFGAIEIKTGVPSTTTDKLYNDGGTLMFHNTTLSGGSGATEINDLSDGKTDTRSLFLGNGSGANDDGTHNGNTAVGRNTLNANISGTHNIAYGYYSLYLNTVGSANLAIGSSALSNNTNGDYNIGLGTSANAFNQEGSNNTIIGYQAGTGNALHNKSGNIFLGYQAGFNVSSDNLLYIENSNSDTPLIWGDFADGREKVRINGVFEVTGSMGVGSNTTATGTNSVALGNYVSTNVKDGSFVFGDNSTTTVLNSSEINRMTMRSDKGYRLYSNAAADVGVFMNAGGNSWLSTSDSTKKENFQSVDGEELLNKISQFKLTTWNYKTQDPTKFRHYGPMAQDFYAAFGNDGIGTIGNDTTIASADFDGINFNAIQALEKRTKIQEASIKYQDMRIKTLENENKNLKTVINENKDLRNEMNIIKATLNKLVKEQPLNKVSYK